MICSKDWGTMGGKNVTLYTLTNSNEFEVQISNYGGIIVSAMAPGKDGTKADVVLGFDTVEEYPEKSQYFGCITGRYANRIANGRFALNGKEYTLATNNAPHHLHGGATGFDQQIWTAETRESTAGSQLVLNWVSPDGDEGYPGDLACEVVYTLTEDNEIKIDYQASTNKSTILNLTNHIYFNLKGAGVGNVLDHELMIEAEKFCAIDSTAIPVAGLADVKDTPFDFRAPTLMGARIERDDQQLRNGIGYDHNWCLKYSRDGKLKHAATVYEPTSGRTLEMHTTEPSLQFYVGNYLNPKIQVGKAGKPYQHRGGFCLEAQAYPDSPNRSDFPSPVLQVGEIYTQTTVYKFGVK